MPPPTTHDKAQRESQPVPYWAGNENVIKALDDGALGESDFDKYGVLNVQEQDVKPPALDASQTPFGRQQKPDLLREPLARLDQALQTAPVPVVHLTEAADAAHKELKVENRDLKAENEELKTEIAFLNEHIQRMQFLLHDFSKLYTLEHPRA